MKRIGTKHILLLLGMVASLTFLYVQVQMQNSQQHHQRMLVLQKLNHWEKTLTQDILRIQTGLLAHYDTLKTNMHQLWTGYHLLSQGSLAMISLDVPELSTQLASYAHRLEQKQEQLQGFTTEYSTLRNSLIVFPLAMEDLLVTMEQHRLPLAYTQQIEQILKDVLFYINRPEHSKTKEQLMVLLTKFQSQTAVDGRVVQEKMRDVFAHVDIILRHQDVVNGLARNLLTSGSDRVLRRLTHDYVAHREASEQDRERYLIVMYLLGILFIGYVAFLFLRLQLSTQSLDRANNDLEHRVTERTEKLASVVKILEAEVCERARAEEQLALARDKALAAMEAKSEFLATMSHEIRTPMNGVIGMTGLLLETPLSSEQKHYAEIVRSSGEMLLTVINDILDFSKIESGKLEFETIDFDLRVALEETLEILAEKAATKKLELVGLVFADVPNIVQGDPGRLRQILINLIGNAIKFTNQGDVTVQALHVKETQEDVVVRFEVTDTGVGIAPDAIERLFQPFSQADSSTTRKYGGTGLGLVISKKLVEQMGGEMGVKSTPGQGSQFWFTIRLSKPPYRTEPDTYPSVSLQGVRVCCIDDHPINRLLLVQYCTDWGMTGVEAESSMDALQVLRSAAQEGKPFELAIVDREMPDMNGMLLAQTIKGDPTIAETKLILVTSLGRRGDAALAREAGFSGYFTKPVRKSQILACLEMVLTQTQTGTETSESALITQYTVREREAQQSARILVADDYTINQQLAVLMLERIGHRVDVVANGLEAVEALSRKSYDVVLMDCQMPEMDGYDATREIRAREARSESRRAEETEAQAEGAIAKKWTPIIAMTANAMQGDREKCLSAGMDDYVSKPLKRDALEKVIAQWLSADRSTSVNERNSSMCD